MIIKIKYLFLIFSLFAYGCSSNREVINKKNDNPVIENNNDQIKPDLNFLIGPGPSDFITDVGNGYTLARTSAHQIMIVHNDGWGDKIPIIPTKVVEIAIQQDLILAKRQGLKRRSPDNPQDIYMEPDPNVYDYWILESVKPKVTGPLTFEEFKKELYQKNITAIPKLEDVYRFSNK